MIVIIIIIRINNKLCAVFNICGYKCNGLIDTHYLNVDALCKHTHTPEFKYLTMDVEI